MMRDSIRSSCGSKLRRIAVGSALYFMGLIFGGCSIVPAVYDGDLGYAHYEALNEPVAEQFVAEALLEAVKQFGAAKVPVNKVLLRRSKPLPEMRRYRLASGFTLTQCADEQAGLFAILMGREESDTSFYPLLGHECFHLLNADLLDWYVEGMATVFSEEFCTARGVAWQERKLMPRTAVNKPYVASFRMMKELRFLLASSDYARMLAFAVPVEDGENERIDIDGWLATLGESDRSAVREIIATYSKTLVKTGVEGYSFTVPADE